MSIYDYSFKDAQDNEVSMKDYAGKVLLIVNTATECGFTPQYKDLQELYDNYNEKGLEILDFPCNQFGNQAPGTIDEIHTFCTGRFGITFPQNAKIDVNGENELPLYTYLKENGKFEGFDKNPQGLMMSALLKKLDKDYKNNNNIKWNFTKFLVDREGNIVKRFEPTASAKKVEEAVKEIL